MIITFEETTTPKYKEVKIRKPHVEDLIQAERIAGNSDGLNYALALMSRIATFDEEKQPVEELKKLAAEDFLQLSQALMGSGLSELAKQLSSSQKKSASKK